MLGALTARAGGNPGVRAAPKAGPHGRALFVYNCGPCVDAGLQIPHNCQETSNNAQARCGGGAEVPPLVEKE